MAFQARRGGATSDAPFLEPAFTDREEAESRARWEVAKRRQAERSALGGTDLATLGVLAAALVGLGSAERAETAAQAVSGDPPDPAPTWDAIATAVDDALTRLTLSWQAPASMVAQLGKDQEATGAEVQGPFWWILGSGASEPGEGWSRPAPAEALTPIAASSPPEAAAPAAAPVQSGDSRPSAPDTAAFAEVAIAPAALPPAGAEAPRAQPVALAGQAPEAPGPESPPTWSEQTAESAGPAWFAAAPSDPPRAEVPSVALFDTAPASGRAEPPVAAGLVVAATVPGNDDSSGSTEQRSDPPGAAVAALAPGHADTPAESGASTQADPPGLAVAAAAPGHADPPGNSDAASRAEPPGLAVAAAAPGHANPPGNGKAGTQADPPGLAVAAAAPGHADPPGNGKAGTQADPPGLAVAAAAPGHADPPGNGKAGTQADPPGLAVAAAAPGHAASAGNSDDGTRADPPGLAVAAAAPGHANAEASAGIAVPPVLANAGAAEDPGLAVALAGPDQADTTPAQATLAASEPDWPFTAAAGVLDTLSDLPPGLARRAALGHEVGPPDHAAPSDFAQAHGPHHDAIL